VRVGSWLRSIIKLLYTLQSSEKDWNRDGKLDGIELRIEMPVDDTETIYRIQLFLLFDVRLYVSKFP
jgi:hypothetical protein